MTASVDDVDAARAAMDAHFKRHRTCGESGRESMCTEGDRLYAAFLRAIGVTPQRRLIELCGADLCTEEARYTVQLGPRLLKLCERCKDTGLLLASEFGIVVEVSLLRGGA